MVQASPTGINAVIDDRGRLIDRTARQVADVLVADVPHRDGLTPYARWNDAPVMALAAATLAVGWSSARPRRGRRPADPSGPGDADAAG